jgi:NADH:ubiquinone oxidoreductase subunit 2 (subunit N)
MDARCLCRCTSTDGDFLQQLQKLQRLVYLYVIIKFRCILVESIVTVLTVIAVLSILVGNLLAVRQVNLKRILVIHQLHTLVIC